MRQAEIYRKGILAGTLTEDGGEYRFCYDEAYLAREKAQPVSLTLPLQEEAFVTPVLFPFFDVMMWRWALQRIKRLQELSKDQNFNPQNPSKASNGKHIAPTIITILLTSKQNV